MRRPLSDPSRGDGAHWRVLAMRSASYRRIRDPLSKTGGPSLMGTLAFLAAHAMLGLGIRRWPALASVHAVVTLLVGLWWALRPNPVWVAYVGAYIAGSEVLWRMSEAAVFWEFGKYATCLVFGVSLLRLGRLQVPARIPAYFLLLLPSAVLTAVSTSASETRNRLSFNLSGPLALMLAMWFFRRLRLSQAEIHRVLLAVTAPVLGVGAIAAAGLLTADTVKFGHGSSLLASGGFAPNQVSAALSLAATAAFLVAQDARESPRLRALMFSVMIVLAIQSALTFSRAGVYMLVTGSLVGILVGVRDRRQAALLLGVVAIAAVLVLWAFVPVISEITGGAIVNRFADTGLTGRDSIIEADLETWWNNPVLGVGPGLAMEGRVSRFGAAAAAHTEFSRLLAEHGTFGLLAIVVLGACAFANVRGRTGGSTVLRVTMMSWSVLFMCVDAMRLVAPAFAFGLASIGGIGAPRSVAARSGIVEIEERPPTPGASRRTGRKGLLPRPAGDRRTAKPRPRVELA
jgi:O-antigen ligase